LSLNYSIDHNVNNYYGTFDAQRFHPPLQDTKTLPLVPMTAIGVRCNASSSVGRADINGIRSSYSNFQRTDTLIFKTMGRCPDRFNGATPWDVSRYEFPKPGWISSLFLSSGAPPPFYGSYLDKNSPTGSYQDLRQLGFLQAEQLRQSMLHAYASYAVELMCSIGQSYTTRNDSQLTSSTNLNVTEFMPGTVIKPNVMPAIVPVALFCIWALVSSTLGIMYGFRGRWTETLGGHTLFRFGAEDDAALDDIPALVGDTKLKDVFW
jgi:hypothetical protein